MDKVTACIGTYGDRRWLRMAKRRAIPSVADQAPVVHVHADTLAQARNAALERATTPYVAFCDADDEWEPGYAEAMMRGTADMRVPMLRQVRRRRVGRPFMPQVWSHRHACTAGCLTEGSWLVVGTAVRTELLRSVGGWWEEPVYEDWSVFLRCHLAGGTLETIPDAIYRAHVNPSGRNHSLPNEERNAWHYKILTAAQAGIISDPHAA